MNNKSKHINQKNIRTMKNLGITKQIRDKDKETIIKKKSLPKETNKGK